MITRPITLILIVSCLVPTTLGILHAADLGPELLFVEGLQKRKFFDLAEKQLDSVLAWPGLSKEEKGVLQFGRAELYEDWAHETAKDNAIPAVDRTNLSEKLLAKALECHKEALAIAPQNEKASKSQFKIGTILKERALTLKKHWDKLEEDLKRQGTAPDPNKQLTPEEKKAEAENAKRRKEISAEMDNDQKEISRVLSEAISYFSKMAKASEALRTKFLEEFQKSNEAEKREKLDKQKLDAEEDMVRAQFEWYLCQQILGEIAGPSTPEGKKNLEEAAKNLKAMGDHNVYGTWVIGKYAIMLEGYCYHLLQKYDQAFKKFDENLAQKDHEAINDVVQKTYFRKAMCAMDAKNYPMVVYTLEGLKHIVTKEDEKDGIEGIAKKYGTLPAVIRELNNVTTNIIKASDWPKKKRPLLISIGMFDRYKNKGIETEEIGKAAKLLVAEALVNWASELRNKQEKKKEWMPKFSRGLEHAVNVAEGEDGWAYKATQVLAKWAAEWREIIGEDTPILFYAEGIYAFVQGYQAVKNSPEQRAYYDQAIRGFQKFTALAETADNEGKEEEEKDEEAGEDKVVDSWYKMGVAYHATNRLHEAALVWNACARYFPKELKGQKAGYNSTIVHGQIYKTKKPPETIMEGYFYEEILRDFVTLFPEHDKVADCQYFIAQLLYGRGDFAAAAAEFVKVAQVSQYYDQAVYLEGVCHSNYFYKLYNETQNQAPDAKKLLDTEEGKKLLETALEKITAYVQWVETEEAIDEKTKRRRIESQGRSAFRLSNMYLVRALSSTDNPERRTEDCKKVIQLTEGFSEKYSPYLTNKDKAELFPQVYNIRLKAFSEIKNLEGAEEMLRMLLAYPDFKDLANAFKYVAQDKTKAADTLSQQATELRGKGQTNEADELEKKANDLRLKAADLYAQLLNKSPRQDASIYLFTGDTYFVNSAYEKAVKYYVSYLKSFAMDPKESERSFEVKYRLGQALFSTKDYKTALQYLEFVEAEYARRQDNKRYLLKSKIGNCLKAMGEYDRAISIWASYKNIIQQESKDWWEAVYEIGEILYLQKDFSASLKHVIGTSLMYPSLGGKEWHPKFSDLLAKLKEALKNDRETVQKIDEVLKKISGT